MTNPTDGVAVLEVKARADKCSLVGFPRVVSQAFSFESHEFKLADRKIDKQQSRHASTRDRKTLLCSPAFDVFAAVLSRSTKHTRRPNIAPGMKNTLWRARAGTAGAQTPCHDKRVPQFSDLMVPTTIFCVGCPSSDSPTHCVPGPYAPPLILSSTCSSCRIAVHTCGRRKECGAGESWARLKERENGVELVAYRVAHHLKTGPIHIFTVILASLSSQRDGSI